MKTDKEKLTLKEYFVDIPEMKDYKISNRGNMKSFKLKKYPEGKDLKPQVNKGGYLQITLFVDGKHKTKEIHQLMAIAFLNHTPCYHNVVVDHKDDNKLNNTLSNLWLTTTRINLSKDKKNKTSSHTGVYWCSTWKTWKSSITHKNKHYYLGSFKTEELANDAYQNALSNIQNNILPKRITK